MRQYASAEDLAEAASTVIETITNQPNAISVEESEDDDYGFIATATIDNLFTLPNRLPFAGITTVDATADTPEEAFRLLVEELSQMSDSPTIESDFVCKWADVRDSVTGMSNVMRHVCAEELGTKTIPDDDRLVEMAKTYHVNITIVATWLDITIVNESTSLT